MAPRKPRPSPPSPGFRPSGLDGDPGLHALRGSGASPRLALPASAGALGISVLALIAFAIFEARPPRHAASAPLPMMRMVSDAPSVPQGPGPSAPAGATDPRAAYRTSSPLEATAPAVRPDDSGASARRAGPDPDDARVRRGGADPLRSRPRAALLMLEQGRAHAAVGRLGDARSAFISAIELDPDAADARYALALVLVRMGDRAGAEAELEPLRELDPSLANLLSGLLRRGGR